MSMHQIEVTGNPAVDTATAEIAVALRNAGHSEREAYEEAMRLRDEIMAGVQLGKDELFFWENAGYSWEPGKETPFQGRMRCARELAAAWQAMQADPGLYVSWDGDNDDCALSEGYTGPVWQAALWQAGPGGSFEDGEILAFAGSVECEDGADLMRVVEAQLALEAGLNRCPTEDEPDLRGHIIRLHPHLYSAGKARTVNTTQAWMAFSHAEDHRDRGSATHRHGPSHWERPDVQPAGWRDGSGVVLL